MDVDLLFTEVGEEKDSGLDGGELRLIQYLQGLTREELNAGLLKLALAHRSSKAQVPDTYKLIHHATNNIICVNFVFILGVSC